MAAGQGTLISLPMDVPSHVARELVFEYESKELHPLMLDPFGLVEGELHWAGSEEFADGDGEDDERDFVQIS